MTEPVTAHTPLICSDERHAAKVADLEQQIAALRAVARGYCPQCGRGDAAPTVTDWQNERDKAGLLEITNRALNTAVLEAAERADRSEATIERVREAAAWTRRNYPGLDHVNDRLAAALDQPAPDTAATQATDREAQLAAALREILAHLYPITRLGDPTPLGYQAIHPIHPRDYQRWTAALEGKKPS